MSTLTETAKGKDGRDYPALAWSREHVYCEEMLHLLAYRAEGVRFSFRVCRWVYTDPILADRTEHTWTVVVHSKFGTFMGKFIDLPTLEAATIYAYDLDRWGF